jgi:hypothetical protein
MASIEQSAQSYLVSTDIGIFHVRLSTVTGYDVEDIIRDRAISQARAVQMLYLGKQISPMMPVTPRTVPSVWLNNKEEL